MKKISSINRRQFVRLFSAEGFRSVPNRQRCSDVIMPSSFNTLIRQPGRGRIMIESLSKFVIKISGKSMDMGVPIGHRLIWWENFFQTWSCCFKCVRLQRIFDGIALCFSKALLHTSIPWSDIWMKTWNIHNNKKLRISAIVHRPVTQSDFKFHEGTWIFSHLSTCTIVIMSIYLYPSISENFPAIFSMITNHSSSCDNVCYNFQFILSFDFGLWILSAQYWCLSDTPNPPNFILIFLSLLLQVNLSSQSWSK